jgi:hypothetical protein
MTKSFCFEEDRFLNPLKSVCKNHLIKMQENLKNESHQHAIRQQNEILRGQNHLQRQNLLAPKKIQLRFFSDEIVFLEFCDGEGKEREATLERRSTREKQHARERSTSEREKEKGGLLSSMGWG